ncbi:MAG: decarboxylating NADP(+)-dependent phosphogluconate dehydrogenase [Pseudomonadota bacterium]|nr:decarboxylating NADP(+)-dependent phosphogluconate dehydrogenase [Pseudomonadota bacterium]
MSKLSSIEPNCDVGLIGLAVMGQNLVLNMADHGFRVAVFNRTYTRTKFFMERCATEPCGGNVSAFETLDNFIKSLTRPRKVVMLVQAGDATEAIIRAVLPLLDEGDVLIDGGNALWSDTICREKELAGKGIHFIGSGVSGGELGARFGPSLMPGGSKEAWTSLEPIWVAIAAKVDSETGQPIEGAQPGEPVTEGEACTTYVGADGAGHYVKMVHNGIEYVDMQLICEAFQLMKELLQMSSDEMSATFRQWNEGELNSFLVEITADILQQRDFGDEDHFLVDRILDAAGQKGTGKWSSQSALDLGSPASAMAEAVFARCLSAQKDERVTASKLFDNPKLPLITGEQKELLIAAVRDALYCSKICAYAQGFALMGEAEKEYGWNLNFANLAKIFRGGCIIRAGFLQKITEAYQKQDDLSNLILDPYFTEQLKERQSGWRTVVSLAAEAGVSCPAFMSALAYFDGYRSATLPANLLQAQRDYFGAHTYERTDTPRGQSFHTDWPNPMRPQEKV